MKHLHEYLAEGLLNKANKSNAIDPRNAMADVAGLSLEEFCELFEIQGDTLFYNNGASLIKQRHCPTGDVLEAACNLGIKIVKLRVDHPSPLRILSNKRDVKIEGLTFDLSRGIIQIEPGVDTTFVHCRFDCQDISNPEKNVAKCIECEFMGKTYVRLTNIGLNNIPDLSSCRGLNKVVWTMGTNIKLTDLTAKAKKGQINRNKMLQKFGYLVVHAISNTRSAYIWPASVDFESAHDKDMIDGFNVSVYKV